MATDTLNPPPATTPTLTLEERVAALEATVAELRRLRDAELRREREEKKGIWSIIGVFADDPTFDEASRLGRYISEHGRLPDEETGADS